MKLTLKTARILVRLIEGETLAASLAKSKLMENLIAENIIYRKGKHRKTLSLLSESSLHIYLANQLQINDLRNYILALENEKSSRAEFVKLTTDSKDSKERVFKGFMVNSYNSINTELNQQKLKLEPAVGSFVFIYAYENFKIPTDVTVIGVENAKNFSQIHQQKYLFKALNPLFVSRYPQNQNKDFIRWMQTIPNKYLHFGDFDLAGIGIYLNEYKKYLGEKAGFFVPGNIQKILAENGNRKRYDNQRPTFKQEQIEEEDLKELLRLIHFEKKGLDQEYFI